MANIDLKSLACLGAQARLAELAAEEDAILRAFSDLGGAVGWGGSLGGGIRPSEGGTGIRRKRKRSRMTPAQRKAVSERMSRYWQRRREAKRRATAAPTRKRVVKRPTGAVWTPAKRRAAAERARKMWAERRQAKKR